MFLQPMQELKKNLENEDVWSGRPAEDCTNDTITETMRYKNHLTRIGKELTDK